MPLIQGAVARALLVTAVAIGGTPALSAPARAEDPAAADRRGGLRLAPAEDLLSDAAHGEAAIRRLGADLPAAAALNDLAPVALKRLLREDETAWVDERGALFYIDPIPDSPRPAARVSAASAQAPLSETFALHSKPGSNRTIFLDLDGGTVTGTFWNSQSGVGPTHPAWDPGFDGPAFNDTERVQVQKIWAMVAEDFAPWDIDVTTQDPGLAALTRSSTGDLVYGTRALITPSTDAADDICASMCGGVAYLDVFNAVVGAASPYDPAWVFPHLLGDDAKAVAEATTHEVGHNLGLAHDGNATQGYDTGHGAWAPIMGVGYNHPIVQFSKGDYVGANNQQDDLAIIARSAGLRTDEAGATAATSAALPAAGTPSFITSRNDVDAFQVGACSAGATIEVTPDATAANLDVGARLLAGDGTVLASADPPSSEAAYDRATGLDATLTVPTAGSGYVVAVDGVGNGSWTTGYDDYASLGAYTLRTTGCSTAGTPGSPTSFTATPDAVEPRIALAWSPPTSSGASAVTGYVVGISGSGTPVTLPASARSHTFTGLAPGTTYDLTVAAVNATGTGPGATARATTATVAVTVPTAPRNVAARWDAPTDRTNVSWTAPASDGGATITSHQVLVDDVLIGSVSAATTAVAITGAPPGAHVVAIRAVNSVGAGPPGSAAFTVGLAPDAPTGVVATRGDGSAVVSWTPGAANGSPITGYTVTSSPGGLTRTVGAGTTSTSLTGLTNGTAYTFRVVATNVIGSSPASLPSAPVTPGGVPLRPTGASASAGDGSAAVSWNPAGANGSPVTGYTVTSSPGGLTRTVGAGTTSTSLTGLTNGTAYTFTVVATNAIGSSPASLPSTPVTPAGVPLRPTGATASAGDGSAVVSWNPAGANGSPVTAYTVTSSPGGLTTTVAGTATAAAVTGLTNGTAYTFTVVATNAIGSSPASLPSAPVIPAGVPTATAPSRVAKPTATVRRGVVRLDWRAPAANGSPITAYRVLGAGRRTVTVAAPTTDAVLRNLRPGLYRLKVVAINAVGASPASPAVRVRLR